MSLRPSRRGLIPPFIAMDMLRAANEREAAGADVIHLEVGQPGTRRPKLCARRPGTRLAHEPIGYTDALGIAPLRQAIAAHYHAQYGVAVDPGEVVVTTGSSAAFQLAFLAAFEAGDRVALAAPGYPAYRNILDGTRDRAGADRSRRKYPLSTEPRTPRRSGRRSTVWSSPARPIRPAR